MNIDTAKQIPISDYLHSLGYSPIKQQGSSLWYKSPFREEKEPSFKVNTDLNLWFDFGLGRGGNILSLAKELYLTDSLPYLLEKIASQSPHICPVDFSFCQQRSEPSFQHLEVRELSHPALLRYLRERGIDTTLAKIECKELHFTNNTPTLFWAGIPGNQADFPAEESFYTFIEQALCMFTEETNYKSSLSPFGIKMVDRVTGKPLHIDISDLPMKQGIITNRNKFILGPSGSGKSFFTNHMVRQYYEQNAHVLLVDTGNSYLGLCEMINRKTHGEDGIYFTYTTENPIAFNPFYVEGGVFDIEKKESIKTLILTLWKRDDEAPTRAEEVALSNAVSSYIDLISKDSAVTPCFNTFYEYVKTDYRAHLQEKNVREKDFDIDNFLNVLEPYYKGGEYDYLLNSDKELDLLHKRFIVFELDNIKDHKILFPITTIIIMEVFINKMRKLKGIRKLILIEEAWKAIASANMADYIKYLYKTVRKYFGEAIVVTQEVEDIISSPIVKESIINNSDCKILLDQRKYLNKFDSIQNLLGLTDKEKSQVLSINLANHPSRKYKEVWVGLGGTQSAVYATEVSLEEYYTYTTEETEKMELFALSEKLGGMKNIYQNFYRIMIFNASALNENKDYQVLNSYFHKSKTIYLMGRKLVRFKGEKISGALIFLEKLKELHSIYSGIELYIERIMKCNMDIYPKLILEVKQMNNELDDLNKKLFDILPIWEKYDSKEKEYDIIRNEIYESVKTDPQYPNNYIVSWYGGKIVYVWQKETEKRLIEQIPEYVTFNKEYVAVKEKYDKLKDEIRYLSSLIKEFKGYQKTISTYFDKVGRSNDLIA